MKTIKVIDLLERCLKQDDTLPKKIKHKGKVYELDYEDDYYFYEGFLYQINNFCDLNKSIEIIEEDKEIEDIDKEMSKLQSEIDLLSNEIGSYHNKIHSMRDRNNYMKETLKDLRKAVNELKKGK